MKAQRKTKPDRAAFTLIELLVVIAIIAILAAILMPVLAAAQAKARKITCVNNNKEIATAILMYISDDNGKFPVLNESNYSGAGSDTNWWWVYLNKGNYMTSTYITNNIWRCPEVKNTDLNPNDFGYFHINPEGYGPFEDTQNPNNCLVRYNLTLAGSVEGGQNANIVKRVSSIWLIGDVGVPKVALTQNVLPASGYYTEVTVIQPQVLFGWVNVPSQKQAACRHTRQAIFSCCDGHVESWKWSPLANNFNDIFAENSY